MMSHAAQRSFFLSVKARFPQMFKGGRVLDCGALDVNGSLRELFTDCQYTGVDLRPGKNVDVVSAVHLLKLTDASFDVVVSAEMLEHDQFWRESLRRMYAILRPGGLLALSMAGEGRLEHGTAREPDEGRVWGSSPDYYRNLTVPDLHEAFSDCEFARAEATVNAEAHDLYLWAIKA
jgi:SAM-dependent methyltransferase